MSCDEVCRMEIACDLDWAVNEQTLLCRGNYIDMSLGSKYFAGVFENPWFKETTINDIVP